MMTETPDDDVKIYAPDMTLKKKLGPGVTFESLVTPAVMQAVEQTVADQRPAIMEEIEEELRYLKSAYEQLGIGSPSERLTPVAAAAFAIKSKAGFCNYPFASELARSLHVFCEMDVIRAVPLSPKTIEVVHCHIRGLQTVFTQKIMGDGGVVGLKIMHELGRLTDLLGIPLNKDS